MVKYGHLPYHDKVSKTPWYLPWYFTMINHGFLPWYIMVFFCKGPYSSRDIAILLGKAQINEDVEKDFF